MYVHIGGEYSVSDKYILGIFDFDGTTGEDSETIRFLRKAEAEGRIEIVSPDLPRSFVVTLDRVYITPISASTLRHRLEKPGEYGRSGTGGEEAEKVDKVEKTDKQTQTRLARIVQENVQENEQEKEPEQKIRMVDA